jgi:hypothetical protein
MRKSQNPIWLDDLMARDVALEWFESVALIRAVCNQIIEEGEEPDSFPTAADVALNADGSVGILQIPPGEAAIPAAARMIIGLASGPFPVQLRLALSQTAAGEPETPTLRAFSETLSFFERPNPRDILQRLHQRAATAPGRMQAHTEVSPGSPVQDKAPAPAAPTIETTTKAIPTNETTPKASTAEDTPPKETTPKDRPLEATRTTETTPKASKNGLRTGRLAAGVVLVAAASGSVVFFVSGAANPHIQTAMGSVRETLLWPASGTPSNAVEKPAQPVRAEAAVTPTPPLRSRAHEAVRRPAAANARSEAPLPSPREPTGSGIGLPLLTRGLFETARMPRVDALVYPERESATVRPEARVYSSTDSGVRPPRPIYPKLPDPESNPTDSMRKDAAVVELLIGTNGLVERVKLRTVPRTIHDIMLLSAAKEWRFDPASRDGAPVRFLYRVAIVP